MFAVVLTGPPGAGKTVAFTALSDALIGDQVEHAAVDVDEVAWSYPFPSLGQRCDHLDALGADEHLLIRLEARLATLRQRIIAREPPGWFGLAYLLDETESLHLSLRELDGVHLVLDTERLGPTEITDRIRSARPDRLSREKAKVG